MIFRLFVLLAVLAGCGAPQTPEEVKADDILSDFMESCKMVYGDRCDVKIAFHSFAEQEQDPACWTENHNPYRYVTLNKEAVVKKDRVYVFSQLLECSMNLGVLEDDSVQPEEKEEFLSISGANNH